MKFYYKDGIRIEGPYSAKEMMTKELPSETMVSEQTIDGGKWKQLSGIDIKRLASEEPELVTFESEQRVAKAGKSERTNESTLKTTYDYVSTDNEEMLPKQFNRWNWGAFVMPIIWGICHGLYWPIGVFGVLGVSIGLIGSISNTQITIDMAFCAANFINGLYLGAKGNQLAWKEKQESRNPDRFDMAQKKWNIAGIVILVAAIIYYLVK